METDVEENVVMFCKNCGKELRDSAAFCSNCGAKVEINNNLKEVVYQEQTSEEAPKASVQSSDDEKKWSEKTVDEKIETVYGGAFFVILVIWAINNYRIISLCWKLSDNIFTFGAYAIVFLISLCMWNIPLCLIKIIYFAVKSEIGKLIYNIVQIPLFIIYALIADAALGDFYAEIGVIIAVAVIGAFMNFFEKSVLNKNNTNRA